MSTFKIFAKALVVVLAIVGLLSLPKMAFRGTFLKVSEKVLAEEEERSNQFEDHLLKAKELVAKELGYEGSLSNLSLYTSHGYYSYELQTANGYDSGSFSDSNARTELNLAVSYRDGHEDVGDVIVAGVNGVRSGVIFGAIVAIVVVFSILGAAWFCINWLDDPVVLTISRERLSRERR